MNIKGKIKSLLAMKNTTLTALAHKLSERMNKKYSLESLIGKIKRETLSLKEAYHIAEILGYSLDFTDKA
ncbi:MAG: hypothetical protein LBJ74_01795 [Heliobacteriaceae bacterium]|jgi:hypothetical protein|nr:hypothetical protein [Heliobacteriaceae bacterium]